MNPLLIAKGAKVLSNKKVITTIIVILVLILLRGTIRKIIRKIRQNRFDKNEGKDVNQLAQQYRAASNPSGISWMIDMDGTDEKDMEILGHQTKGKLQAVADAYKLKFNESLSDRIRKELSPDDFHNWRNIVT